MHFLHYIRTVEEKIRCVHTALTNTVRIRKIIVIYEFSKTIYITLVGSNVRMYVALVISDVLFSWRIVPR